MPTERKSMKVTHSLILAINSTGPVVLPTSYLAMAPTKRPNPLTQCWFAWVASDSWELSMNHSIEPRMKDLSFIVDPYPVVQ